MPTTMMGRAFLGTALAVMTASLLAGQVVNADQWRTVDTRGSGLLIERDTPLNQLDPVLQQLFLPDANQDVKLSSTVQLFPLDPRELGAPRARGRARATMECFTAGGNQVNLGTRSGKINRNGGAAVTRQVPESLNCEFFRVFWTFAKNTPIPAGTSVEFKSAAELVNDNADNDCFGRTTLCLNDDRFKVEVDWKDFDGRSGPGIALPRTDDSGTFFFFDPDNTELLLKVLDGCRRNGHYWVFYAATTNVEFSISVTDTLSGQSRVYDNPLGRPAPAIIDTQAFATCP